MSVSYTHLKHGFVSNKESEDYIYSQFLSLDINKNSIILLSNVIKEIAKKGNCVIVGRAADYILKEDEKLVRIFLYAPLEYRLNKVMEIYHDSHEAVSYAHLVVAIELTVTMFLTPYWLQTMYGIPFFASQFVRILKSCVMIPVGIIIVYTMNRMIQKVIR